MTTNALITAAADVKTVLMPADPDRDTKHRVAKFAAWMAQTNRPWHQPDLAEYRNHLQAGGKSPATVSAHLSTVRSNYRRLITDNAIRQALFDQAAETLTSAADRKAFVDETITRIQNAIDPSRSVVKTVTKQDVADSAHLRLTKAQADALLAAPGVGDLKALRDTAVIAMLLCTGIREAELCGVEMQDLRQELGGELALHVRKGKGCKERLVPYGELSWVLVIVDRWLARAGIGERAVFRSFEWQGGETKSLRDGLTRRSVQRIVARYPVAIGGVMRTVKPHDLRRTYARRLYEAGVAPVAIQQNLGHADLKTTLGYIGELDASQRRAPAVYSFDLAKLNNAAA